MLGGLAVPLAAFDLAGYKAVDAAAHGGAFYLPLELVQQRGGVD